MNALPVLLAAGGAVAAAPYLAGLSRTVAQKDNRRWWRPERASWRRVGTVTVIAVALSVLGAIATRWGTVWAAYLALALSGAVLIVVDAEQHRLPDRLTGVAAVAGAALLTIAAATDGAWSRLGRVALAAAIVFAVFYAMALISPRGVGLGDVKLAALLAGYLAWFGWLTVLTGLAAGFLIAGVVSIGLLATQRATRATQIPLGPFLIVAVFVVVALRP